jgi:hypothetical protein
MRRVAALVSEPRLGFVALLQEIHGYDSRFGLRVFKQSVLDSLVAEKGGPAPDGMDVDEPEPGKLVVGLFDNFVAIDVPQSRSNSRACLGSPINYFRIGIRKMLKILADGEPLPMRCSSCVAQAAIVGSGQRGQLGGGQQDLAEDHATGAEGLKD